MRIHIHSRTLALPPPLRTQIDRRVQFALARFAHRVRAVHVRLSDLNGPRGGSDDQRCQVEVSLIGGTPIVAEDRHHDIAAALTVALDRASRAVARQVKRTTRGITAAPGFAGVG